MFVRAKMLSWAAVGAAVLGTVALAPAQAQETVKIGLILPMTGGQASTGKQMDNAVKPTCSRTAIALPARRSKSS